MLKTWWWKWSLSNSTGPIGLAQQLTEPIASKIITSSLLGKKKKKTGDINNSQKEGGGESEEREWITDCELLCFS